jgi:hypothetical protein
MSSTTDGMIEWVFQGNERHYSGEGPRDPALLCDKVKATHPRENNHGGAELDGDRAR